MLRIQLHTSICEMPKLPTYNGIKYSLPNTQTQLVIVCISCEKDKKKAHQPFIIMTIGNLLDASLIMLSARNLVNMTPSISECRNLVVFILPTKSLATSVPTRVWNRSELPNEQELKNYTISEGASKKFMNLNKMNAGTDFNACLMTILNAYCFQLVLNTQRNKLL